MSGLRSITGVISALFLVSGLTACKEAGKSQASADPPAAAVQVSRVQVEEINEERKINGDIMPWTILPLSFTVGGRVKTLSFEEGDELKKGQLLATLDTKDYRLVRDLAKAQVDALRPHLQRAEFLVDKEAVSQSQLDELASKMSMAKIQKSQADSQLSYSRLSAPMSGIVLRRMASVGDMTDAQHPVGILAEMSRVKVILPVAQRDLPMFVPGGPVDVVLPGEARRWVAKVDNVGYAADEKTRTFPVTLELENEDLYLRAGMIVEARVLVRKQTGIFLSLDAVGRNLEGKPRVLLAVGNKAEPREVILGSVFGERVEVSSGLAPGDLVIVRGLVGEGDPLRVVSTEGSEVQPSPQAAP